MSPFTTNVSVAAAAAVVVVCYSIISSSILPKTDAFNTSIDWNLLVLSRLLTLPAATTRLTNSLSLAASTTGTAGDNSNRYDEVGASSSRNRNKNNPTYELAHATILRSRRELHDRIHHKQYEEAKHIIQRLLQIYSDTMTSMSTVTERTTLSSEIDSCMQELLVATFATPTSTTTTTNDRRSSIMIGIDVMNLQLGCQSRLATPFNHTIRRRILSQAITAITSLSPNDLLGEYNLYPQQQQQQQSSSFSSRRSYLTLSYRLLQRLISGVGVRRGVNDGSIDVSSILRNGNSQQLLSERDFNQVLHAHCKLGHMVPAERIVKLQEQTIQRLPISLVTFSILLKGYGQKMDVVGVERTIQRTKANHQTLDTIMVNTMIDAYINCNAMDQAEALFSEMRSSSSVLLNRRTYNTYMKGLAKQGALAKAQRLATEMKQMKVWDSVTTNTLVHASITAGNLTYAEEILNKETMRWTADKYKYQQHPNVEAYTELLDAYSKTNQLDRSLSVLQTMQHRNVEPNEVTYTCLMGGLGRNRRIDLAKKILVYMQSRCQRPTTKVYNSLISGLLLLNETRTQDMDCRVDDGIQLLREMKQSNVSPNAVTISAVVDALGRCTSPRVVEAQLLVDEFTRTGYVSSTSDNRVLTSLIRVYGRVENIQGVTLTFQKLKIPDTVAVNAYIDACCRCGRERAALDAFEQHLRRSRRNRPDIVSYAILIGSILKRSSTESLKLARLLYAEMKTSHNIHPDNGLIDVILKNMIRIGSSRQLTKQHVVLIVDVLSDAERLLWDDGQLDRRKRAIRAIVSECFGSTMRPNDPIFTLIPASTSDNDLFDRKGWNQVQSGFRLWGQIDSKEGKRIDRNNGDDFLKSRGWNDVDSSFRIF